MPWIGNGGFPLKLNGTRWMALYSLDMLYMTGNHKISYHASGHLSCTTCSVVVEREDQNGLRACWRRRVIIDLKGALKRK